MENKTRKGVWLIAFMLFIGSIFIGDVCFAEDQNIFLRSDVNSDLQTDYFDFSEFAKYWQWIDLRDESHFEIYQDYIDFWDPNTGDSSSFDVSGKQFDFDEDGVVGSIDLMFMCDEWLMTGYSYPRGVLTSKVSDVDLDGVVGPMDLAYFSEYWLWFDVRDPNNFQTPQDYEDFWDPNTIDPNTIDFTGMYFDFTEDGHVNLADLGILAQDWLGVAEHLPSNISVEFSGDINYLDGVVDYELQGFKNTTKEIYVLLDSKIMALIQ